MTEQEATTKHICWRTIGTAFPQTCCLGSACAAWRWERKPVAQKPTGESRDLSRAPGVVETIYQDERIRIVTDSASGFCGLAGKP